ncbi:MAG: CCC motif membrane protein [Eudoraea sp.]|jgi:hypothetical protein|uniref:CCC motif membrane protein n=1 Tax=Eudoraea sp. TaxID=1979955 RepID=UPI003C742AC6
MNQQALPGANTALIMGIISIIGAISCCGPFAIIFSIIGLVNAKNAEQLYKENPQNYTGFESVRTGRILSYVGMALAIIYLVFAILYFGVIMAFISSGNF